MIASSQITNTFSNNIRKICTLETKLVYNAKWCSGEKVYRRNNNSSFETLDSRLAIEVIALKAINVIPALLFQKPSKDSKSKDHSLSLERRLKLFEEGNVSNLLHEGETIQDRMKISGNGMNIEKISWKFKKMMSKGNVDRALKLLMENMSNRILPLKDKTLKMLKQKHPKAD